MEYQKAINLLDKTLYQSTKFRTKNWNKLVEINDNSHGMDIINSQMLFKTSMLKSNLCDHG